MKNRKITISLIILSIFIALLIILPTYQVKATQYSSSWTSKTKAKSYDSVAGVDVNTLFSYDWSCDNDSDRAKGRIPNFLCLHHGQNSPGNAFKLVGVLDINADGSDYKSWTWYYRTNGGVQSKSGSSSSAAEIAWLAYRSHKNVGSKSDGSSPVIGVGTSTLFIQHWDSSIYSLPGYSTSGISSSLTSWPGMMSTYAECGDYGQSADGKANGKAVKARILYFTSCWTQDTAMLFGKLTDKTDSKIENDKYITMVNSSPVTPGGRAGKDDSWKRSNLPEVDNGDIITYEIPITNKGTGEAKDVAFEDTFDTECFEAISSGYCTISGATFSQEPQVTAGGVITAKIGSIAANGTATITVKLKVKDDADLDENTPYSNGAKAGSNSYVYDYVKVNGIKLKIDKYITKTEHVEDTVSYGTARANKEDSWKYSKAAQISKQGTIVYYHITIKNEGNKDVQVSYNDTYATVFSQVSGTFNETFTLNAGAEKSYDIALSYDSEATYGKYENKATIIVKTKQFTSSDWVEAIDRDPPEINKYITSITNGGTIGSRSSYTEAQKAANPADGGENDTAKTITYTVTIKNNRDTALSGSFSDSPGSGLSSPSISPSAGNVTIAANSTVTYTVTVTLPANADARIYANTAYFTYEGRSIESKDYFVIKAKPDEPTEEGQLWKYISNVSGGDITPPGSVLVGGNRKNTPKDSRELAPVEVSKGTLVTYTLEAYNNVEYENKSGYSCCNPGEQCEEHLERTCLDELTCVDEWDTGLELVSVSGATYESQGSNKIKLKWTNVEFESTATATVTLRVTASDMTLPNIENKATELKYMYKNYSCYWQPHYHPEERTGSYSWTDENGASHTEYYSYTVQVHDCPDDGGHWEHPYEEKKGDLPVDETYTHDYVRLLDPYVSGCVWDDINKDGFHGSDEDFSTIIADYNNISVKLWKDGDSTPVATETVNDDGTYSFGRVRKATTRSDGNMSEWAHVADGQSFNTNGASLQSYYITFEYNGERYHATEARSEAEWNQRESYSRYREDSNAEEQNRTEFNNSLETIAHDRAFAGTTGSASNKVLGYNTSLNGDLQESKLRWDGSSLGAPSTSWPSNYTVDVDENRSASMIAKTYNFYVSGIDDAGEIDYLQYIDLGIWKRDEDPTLSLTKDVVQAEVTVNNHQTIYEFGGGGTTITEDGETYDYRSTHNVQNQAYTLSVYREDYEFRTEKYKNGSDTTIYDIAVANNRFTDLGRDNDLHVILTYKITVKNDSTAHKAVVREIIDYASSNLILVDAHLDSIDGATLTVGATSNFLNTGGTTSKATRGFITGTDSKNLAPGGTFDVYVRYRVDKDSEGYLKIDDVEAGFDDTAINDSKFNIAEIGAYSIYDMDGSTPSGYVDQNSNPGNVEFDGEGNPISYDTGSNTGFEDDTFETGIFVILKDTPPGHPGPKVEKYYYRNISGIVFEEIDKAATSTSDGQKVGDGIQNGSDIPAENVLVKLYEVVRKSDGSEEYYVDTGLWYRTGSDGRYYFGDETQTMTAKKPDNSSLPTTSESTNDCYLIHAGLYTVRFIYGDEKDYFVTTDGNLIKYSGQDYQSVKYKEVGNASDETEIIKASVYTTTAGNANPFSSEGQPTSEGTIYSVAKDNEIRRLEVMEYSTTTTYLMDSVLKANNSLIKTDADGKVSANIANPSSLELIAHETDGTTKSKEAELLAKRTSMFADTRIFDMDIEYYDNYREDPSLSITKESMRIDGKVKTIVKYYYSVRGVNFGITERPRTKLQLMNDITEVRAITSDGQTLIDMFFDIIYEPEDINDISKGMKHTAVVNYDKSTGWQEVQVLNRAADNTRQGFRYANIDSDLLQGMTITLKFRIAVANISETDHIANWLEEAMKQNVTVGTDTVPSSVDLNVVYEDSSITYPDNELSDSQSTLIDKLYRQKRNYNYQYNYLYKLLYSGDSSHGSTQGLTNADFADKLYFYDSSVLNFDNTKGSKNVRKLYTPTNIKNKVQSNYETGYYVGKIYYGDAYTNEAKVETRVDQFIDYVDNDLVFKPEENVDRYGQMTYQTYTTKQISEKGLLKDISYDDGGIKVTKITDGEKDYYNEGDTNTNNNLAFNIEKAIGTTTDETGANVTLGMYKFMNPIKADAFVDINDLEHTIPERPGDGYYDYNKNQTADSTINVKSIGNPWSRRTDETQEAFETRYNNELNKYFYVMDLQASRILTNETIDGIIIDNIAEIVKTTNTVGRKVYVSAENSATGYLGNTTKEPIESVNKPGSSTTLVDIAKLEIDTDFTEYVTFSPPTGLTEGESLVKTVAEQTGSILLIIVPVIIIIAGMSYVTVQFVRRKKFYK